MAGEPGHHPYQIRLGTAVVASQAAIGLVCGSPQAAFPPPQKLKHRSGRLHDAWSDRLSHGFGFADPATKISRTSPGLLVCWDRAHWKGSLCQRF